MGEKSVADRVRKVTAKILKIDESQVKPESHFVKDLGAQSIQSVELVAAFEEEFDIEMDEDEALEVKTVGDAVAFIQKSVDEQ
ncbi:MAG: acyl carrier protein [Planctomycetota bacterium]